MKNIKFLIIILVLTFTSCEKKEDNIYMGSRSCQVCHQEFYKLWSTSFHGLSMQNFNDEFAQNKLSPCLQSIKVGNSNYQYIFKKNKAYIFESPGNIFYPIELVLGGKYVYYFLTPLENGKLQTLPLGYDVKLHEWFDITSSSIRMHQAQNDEALPWTDRRYTFNSACYDCHVSQLTSTYNIENDSYQSVWLENGINCETCHGPAEKHNSKFLEAKEKGLAPDSSYLKTFTRSRGYSKETVDASCSYCHAKEIRLTEAYIPGEDFFQHFDLICAENTDYYPDARDLGENYTLGSWLMSPCRADEGMDCLHCHTSSGRFRQKDTPNTACLPCHQNRVENASLHTHHSENSPGNECIACHMPKTHFARMDRSDHSMRPPVPALTSSYGSPNACNDCHTNKSPQWAESFILEHFSGKWQNRSIIYANYLDQLRKGESEHLDDILTYIKKPLDEFSLTSMIRALDNFKNDRIKVLLNEFLNHKSPLIRSSAASGLGKYRDPFIDNALIEATKDSVLLVRVRAVAEILDLDTASLEHDYKPSYKKAIGEYKQSLIAYPDEESSHYNLGHFHEMRGENKQALKSYKHALKLRPELSQAANNMGMIYYENAQIDSALYFLQEAVRHQANDAAPYLNLGLLYAELSYTQEAISQLEISLQKEASATAAYNLAVLYSKLNPKKSLENATLAHRLQPHNSKYSYTLAYYLSEQGKCPEAMSILQSSVDEDRASFNIYYLLSSLYKNSGKTQEKQKLEKKIKRDKTLSYKEKEILTK